ncbi:helix-turn-helix transcriptional regulator [Terriglobus roseus]|uniref:Predicted DNA-binding transcriptional regulator YafY, contains an HTH and WYL domains n=1 Tax=Terriglobus roseus TaxID=392734 RepID=A0A1H4LFF6_9BACT|nr:YafY family protein [Terriglobus roseus]SEB69451.1 Predicted DNA-binding transcriptional regulator YafY, contains an HTH and WYL domains [Terriglobus roseus]
MRRADRLFRIVSLLRSGRMLTGAQLAERLQISPRTLYRDVADLQRTGTPIIGEAGVGYTLRKDDHLPPMHFTPEELTALVLGARMAGAWGSESTQIAANDALLKIEAALPAEHRSRVDRVLLFAPPFPHPARTRKLLDRLHNACAENYVLRFGYADEAGRETERAVHPLGLFFWGNRWTLVAWCRRRDDFRHFRLDRMREVAVSDEVFASRRGQRLEDFIRKVRSEKPTATA